MIVQRTWKSALLAAFSMALIACGGEGTDTGGTTGGPDTLDTMAQQHKDGGVMKVGGKLFSIPSPVETAMLIHKAGLPYKKDLPLATEKADALTTKSARGLALGMYGADMAYVTIHKDGQRALGTMQVIEKLGTALEVSNAFDRALFDRFKGNMNNQDSLLRMSGEAFRAADQYLKTNERDDVSALVLAGGWIESMHLTLSSAPKLEGDLAQRVGEQKRTLTDLIALLEQSDKEKALGTLIASLKDLRSVYDGINSTYQYEAPVTDVSGMTTHINSKSATAITDEQIKAITDKLTALRSTIFA